MRGALKKSRGTQKNLVVVGDRALIDVEKKTIAIIMNRSSLLSRSDSKGTHEKLIAANIDLALITACLVDPPLQISLLDRYIIACKKGGLKAAIVINKCDLIEPKSAQERELKELEETYDALGIPVIAVSASTGQNIEKLRGHMKGLASAFVGESGVGKSSLINILTASDLATGEVSEKSKKGTHTTTSAKLIALKEGGFCVDTPGIQYLGFWKLSREDLKSYFPEFEPYAHLCFYPNCSHSHEPSCAVLQALSEGKLSLLRYNSYKALLEKL